MFPKFEDATFWIQFSHTVGVADGNEYVDVETLRGVG